MSKIVRRKLMDPHVGISLVQGLITETLVELHKDTYKNKFTLLVHDETHTISSRSLLLNH